MDGKGTISFLPFPPLPSDKANLVGGGGGGGALDGKRRMGGYVHGSMEEGEEFHGPRKFAIYEGKEEGKGRKRSGACLSSSGGAVGRSSLGRQQCPDKKVIVPPLPPSLHPFNFLHIFQEPNEPRRYFTSRKCCRPTHPHSHPSHIGATNYYLCALGYSGLQEQPSLRTCLIFKLAKSSYLGCTGILL